MMKKGMWVVLCIFLALTLYGQDSLTILPDGKVMILLDGSQEELAQFLNPVGTVQAYVGTADPAGWMICDGRSLSKSQYPKLFAVVGYSFGGSGESFNLPDLRGQFLRGADDPDGAGPKVAAGQDPDANTRTAAKPGGNTGNAVGSSQSDRANSVDQFETIYPNYGGHDKWVSIPDDGTISPYLWTGANAADDVSIRFRKKGGETRPKNVYVNFIIKY